MDLKLCTFNCCSLRKNIDIVRELSNNKFDIILLQETFITEDKIGILDFIDERYECIGVPATYSEKVLTSNAGRPEGGMAVMWRTASKIKVRRITFESNFMVFNFALGNKNIVIVNVYMNSDLWDVEILAKYLQTLSKLQDILEDIAFDSIYFVGDFNADPTSGRAWRNLSNFIERNSLKCFDVEALPPDSHTFVGYGNSTTRWLDHVVGRQGPVSQIHDIRILYELIGSDHLPMEFYLKIDNVDINEMEDEPVIPNTDSYILKWEYIRPAELKEINRKINFELRTFYDNTVFHCTRMGCRDKNHLKEIDGVYYSIVVVIRESAERFKRKTIRKDKFKIIPGWNRNVKSLYSIARNHYLEWIATGRMLNTPLHENMKSSRKRFKAALRNCKLNENKEIGKSITEKFHLKNMKEFWNDVKKQKGIAKRTNIVEGENDNNRIVNIFADRFFREQALQNDKEQQFLDNLRQKWKDSRKMYVKISAVTLKKLIANLKSGMGHDGIHAIFLKGADDLFLEFLANFYNSCFIHCYIPFELLKGVMNPTIKDIKGNITEASNYRPVMQSSCLLKLFESHLLNIISEKITFNQRQFGFTKGVSTTDTCFLLKEVVYEYSKSKKNGIITFIDLSKAFDRVDHFKLGELLMREDIPIDIVFILMHYLRNQSAKIVWNNASSEYRTIEWGVRQGGILSPFLFKFYINSLIDDISAMEEGCCLGISKLNILAYADDIALIASSIPDMNSLYDKLKNKFQELGLQINQSKTKCMFFGLTDKKCCPKSAILAGDELERVSTYKYLGHYIEQTLNDDKDIENKLMKFYASTNSVLRNFYKVDVDTLLFLFTSYCKPSYGLTLWNNRSSLNRCFFKPLNTAFNNTLKKIINVPLYASNHVVADISGHLLLGHQIALLQSSYYFRLLNSRSFLIRINRPFLKLGYFFKYIQDLFNKKYDVNISCNDPDVIKSRIIWVQKHEARRGTCPYFLI